MHCTANQDLEFLKSWEARLMLRIYRTIHGRHHQENQVTEILTNMLRDSVCNGLIRPITKVTFQFIKHYDMLLTDRFICWVSFEPDNHTVRQVRARKFSIL